MTFLAICIDDQMAHKDFVKFGPFEHKIINLFTYYNL